MKKLILIFVLLLAHPVYAQQRVDVEPLRNGISNGTITVTTSQTAIPTTALSGRKAIVIVNISSGNIFVGDSSVTTSNGYQLYTQQSISLDVSDDIIIYGIVSTGTGEVRYFEVR
jgi:hypothetical protein